MTFHARLSELIEKAAKGYSIDKIEQHVASLLDVAEYLFNHAEAIRDLVVAAEQEHGGNHHEPECPICVALAKFNDAGEK